ncbi:MAG: PEGA domain-containing protein [Polyangia bacterium]
MRRIFFKAMALVALLGASAEPALADEPTPVQREEADRHFARGKELFAEERYLEAVEEFDKANEIAPHPVVMANIGICYERAGKVMKALESYRAVIADPQTGDEQTDEIWDRIDALEARLGTIDINCPVLGCRVVVDGEDRGPAPLTLRVLPGTHKVEGEQAGENLLPQEITVSQGEVTRVELERAPQQAEQVVPDQPQPDAQEDQDDGGAKLGAPFWIAAGVTAAGGIGIIVAGSKTLEASDEYESSDRQDDEAKRSGLKSKLATNVMIGITAAAGATAAALAIWDLAFAEEEQPKADQEQVEARAGVAPLPGGGLQLGVTGEF